MALHASDIKRLWGKAGAKCSICKCDLFLKDESDTNIGKECHISSHSQDHPSASFSRYDSSLTEDERDKRYDNAILLCGPHHDAIDDPENTQYTIDKLHQIKAEHEAWITEKFEEDTVESRRLKRRLEELKQKFGELVRLKEQEIELSKKQMNRERVTEMLREFISLLISDLEGKIEEIDRVLSGDKRFALTLIRPSYKYADTNILGDENYKWIKEKIDEYNNLVRGERLEEAKETATGLKNKLEELKKKHARENSITEKEIEKKKYTPYVIKERKRT